MSRANSVSPSLEPDRDTYLLQRIGGTNLAYGGNQGEIIGGVPSNWDLDPTPQPLQNRNIGRRNSSDYDIANDPTRSLVHNPLTSGTTDGNYYVANLEVGSENNSEIGSDSVESIRLDVDDLEKSRFDNEVKNDRGYTPALPRAEKLDELRYDSPSISRAESAQLANTEPTNDTTEKTFPEAKLQAFSQHLSYSPSSDEDLKTLDKSSHKNFSERRDGTCLSQNGSQLSLQVHNSAATHAEPPHRAKLTNRVSPTDEEYVQRSRPQGQASSASDLRKQKSFIFGADDNTDSTGCCGWLLYGFSILLIVVTLPFSLIFCIKVVQEYERAVMFRLGRLPSGGAKGPGIFFIIPCIESYTKIDLRTVSFDVPPQEVLTKDSVTVSVDAVVYYRVSNPTVSVANVENAHHSTRLLAQTTLRNILGTKDMSEILSDRESISLGMQSTLDEATERWGIKVERVEIKDVRLPVQLQRAMAAEAEAAREARAKVIAAEGEQKASRALKEAADVMGQSSGALQLRYLQTLSTISAEKNSTIIFPLPIDLMKAFMDKKS